MRILEVPTTEIVPPHFEIEFTPPSGPTQRTGFCELNLNLLAHAQAIELDIGSRCGGHGICGGDRVRIIATPGGTPPRLSPLTEREIQHLSKEEIEEGWRLGCQCFPEVSAQTLHIVTS